MAEFKFKSLQWGARHNFHNGSTTEAVMGQVYTPDGELMCVYVQPRNETYSETRARVLKKAEEQYGRDRQRLAAKHKGDTQGPAGQPA